MKKLLLILAFCLTMPSPRLVAQHHAMQVAVEFNRITIGGEFVPRCVDLPVIRTVVEGASDELHDGTYDCIEVAGALTISGTVSVKHLMVLPTGTLTIACGTTITGRDVPLNLTADPFQWGNGLLNFGTLIAKCPVKTPFVALAGAAAQGASTLTLAAPPTGWSVGDAVMVTDSRQMKTGSQPVKQFPVREPNATITAIVGNTISLSTPLAFARPVVARPDGSVVATARVANLSRQTTIQSENPLGTPWHIANVGPDAGFDIEGVEFVGLGRTKNIALHVDTNHVGRYAFHIHHIGAGTVRRIANSVSIGTGAAKWGGIVVHQSHDSVVEDNVCVDQRSGCLVTEDGNELRNVFRGNLAAFALGNGVTAQNNVKALCPGCESAFWFRGVGNVYEGNEVWNSQVGFSLFNQGRVAIASAETVPMVMTDNLAIANERHGMEYWSMQPFPNERLVSAHNGRLGIWNAFPERGAYISLVDGIILCADGQTNGIEGSSGYVHGLEMLRGEIRGCNAGVYGGIAKVLGRFTDTRFQNVSNFPFVQRFGWPASLTFTRAVHEPLPGFPSSYLNSVAAAAWSGSGPFPADVGTWMQDTDGTANFRVEDWQGTGESYRIVYPAQRSSALAWHPRGPNDWMLPPPECGTTLGETWANCGMTFGGETFDDGDEVYLPGVVNLVAVSTAPKPLGVPRAIMTTPNSSGAFTTPPLSNGTRLLNFALTGDMTQADDRAYLSIDGGPRIRTTYRRGGPSSAHYVGYATSVTAPGTHSVRTWRELAGVEVAGSSMTFGYVVP